MGKQILPTEDRLIVHGVKMEKQIRRAALLFDGLVIVACGLLLAWFSAIIAPAAGFTIGEIIISGDAVIGGLFSFAYLFAIGMTGRYGAATVACLEQLVILLCAVPSLKIIQILLLLSGGLSADLLMKMIRHRVCCARCSLAVGAVSAALTGLSIVYGGINILIAVLSGGLGGLVAYTAAGRIRTWGAREAIYNEAETK